MKARDLLNKLNSMSDEQLDSFDAVVSEGCDDNGNAEFFPLDDLCIVGDGVVDSAADGVLEEGSPVLLFGKEPEEFKEPEKFKVEFYRIHFNGTWDTFLETLPSVASQFPNFGSWAEVPDEKFSSWIDKYIRDVLMQQQTPSIVDIKVYHIAGLD